jgi:two-component system chemotaxis response regulator CheY
MPSILIIDDSLEDGERARKILNGSGYHVCGIARDGEVGTTQYIAVSPDLVIIDLLLPGMNGIEVMNTIKSANPDAKVILCTSAGQGSVVDLAMRSGANGYVVKPYDSEILLSAVRRILGSPG